MASTDWSMERWYDDVMLDVVSGFCLFFMMFGFISVHEFVFFLRSGFLFDCISFVCQSAVSRRVILAFVVHIVCHGSLTLRSRTLA